MLTQPPVPAAGGGMSEFEWAMIISWPIICTLMFALGFVVAVLLSK